MSCGIYLLLFNDSIPYIGQSRNIEARFSGHKYDLQNNLASVKMQEAYYKFGMPSLSIIALCSIEELDSQELLYINEFNSVEYGLNTNPIPSMGIRICGEDSVFSSYQNSTYESIFNILIECPEIPFEEVSSFLEIPKHIIVQISSGKAHLWLKDKYPEKYLILEALKHNRGRYTASPNGKANFSEETYIQVLSLLVNSSKSLRSISEETGVPYGTVRDIKNKHRHYWLEKASPIDYAKLNATKIN